MIEGIQESQETYESILIEQIVLDENVQMREALDKTTVEQYVANMENGDSFPPIVVYLIDGRYILSCGYHRMAAHKQLGKTEILAEVKKGTINEAFDENVLSNKSHGKAWTQKERRKIAMRYLSDPAWEGRSDRWIAKRVGVCNKTVGSLRETAKQCPPKDEVRNSSPQPMRGKQTSTGEDGKEYPRGVGVGTCGDDQLSETAELDQYVDTEWLVEGGPHTDELVITEKHDRPEEVFAAQATGIRDWIQAVRSQYPTATEMFAEEPWRSRPKDELVVMINKVITAYETLHDYVEELTIGARMNGLDI